MLNRIRSVYQCCTGKFENQFSLQLFRLWCQRANYRKITSNKENDNNVFINKCFYFYGNMADNKPVFAPDLI